MSSPELTVVDGVEFQPGTIATLCGLIAPVELVVSAPNRAAARDAYLEVLNCMPIRTYRNQAGTADITLDLRWTNSIPAGSTWTPGDKAYIYPIEARSDGLYLAYTAAVAGGFNQLSAEIEIAIDPSN